MIHNILDTSDEINKAEEFSPKYMLLVSI